MIKKINRILPVLLIRLLDGATDSIQKLLKGIENGIYDKLVDFDSHLDGIDSDWTNPAINSLIDEQNTN